MQMASRQGDRTIVVARSTERVSPHPKCICTFDDFCYACTYENRGNLFLRSSRFLFSPLSQFILPPQISTCGAVVEKEIIADSPRAGCL
ncbi:hypothetical protein L596_030217 [Steinernema carpocapsae]|uniref:Uncharacterized protein n=1 Tax=Steinernema carpocapsae TaxID=34508 RepID=A0A4U5LS26_STECR|nr:hypothetical protein L596_030217 [Steinernema carpocapsae]